MYRFSVRFVLAMPCSGCSDKRRFDGKRATRRDENDVARIPMMNLPLYHLLQLTVH